MPDTYVRVIYRRVDNGRIVTKEYAINNPNTTAKETMQIVRKKKQTPKNKK